MPERNTSGSTRSDHRRLHRRLTSSMMVLIVLVLAVAAGHAVSGETRAAMLFGMFGLAFVPMLVWFVRNRDEILAAPAPAESHAPVRVPRRLVLLWWAVVLLGASAGASAVWWFTRS